MENDDPFLELIGIELPFGFTREIEKVFEASGKIPSSRFLTKLAALLPTWFSGGDREYGIARSAMRWALGLGTQWDPAAFAAAVFEFYGGDVTPLEALRSLGCPWDSSATSAALEDYIKIAGLQEDNFLVSFKWLVKEGCPVSPDAQGILVEIIHLEGEERAEMLDLYDLLELVIIKTSGWGRDPFAGRHWPDSLQKVKYMLQAKNCSWSSVQI